MVEIAEDRETRWSQAPPRARDALAKTDAEVAPAALVTVTKVCRPASIDDPASLIPNNCELSPVVLLNYLSILSVHQLYLILASPLILSIDTFNLTFPR